MRVSSNQLMDVPMLAMRDAGQRWSEASRQITDGTRVHRASDGPVALAAVSRVDEARAVTRIHQANIADLERRFSAADVRLGAMTESLLRVKELLVQARNGSLGSLELRAIGGAVNLELTAVGKELSGLDSQGRTLFVPQTPEDGRPLEIRPRLEIEPWTVLALERFDGGAAPAFDLAAADDTAIRGYQEQVDAWLSAVLAARSDVGSRWELMERSRAMNATADVNLSGERSALIDTDVAAAAAELAKADAQLRAAQALFARIETGGLFALLR
jgi:flagellin-like hook-associated protein FlgL